MSESFTTQGNDFLSPHRSTAASASSTPLADTANTGRISTAAGAGSTAAAPASRGGSGGNGGNGSNGTPGMTVRPATASPQFNLAVQGSAFGLGEAERAVARPQGEDVTNSGCCPVGSRTADCDKEAAAGIVSAAAAAASAGPSDSGVTISTSSACESSLMIGAASALAGDSKSVAANAISTASGVVAGMQSLVHHSAATRISPEPLASREDGSDVASVTSDSASAASSPRCRGVKRRGSDSSIMLMAVDEATQCARKIYRSETTHSGTGGDQAGSPPSISAVASKRRRNYAPAAASSAAGGAAGSRKRSSSTRAATGGIYRSRASARISSALSSSTSSSTPSSPSSSHLTHAGDQDAMMACVGSRGACSAVGPSASRGTATVVGRGSASTTATAGAGNSGSAHAPSSSTSFSRIFPIVSHGGVAVAQAVRQRGDRVAASVRHGSSGGTGSILVLNAATGVTSGNSSISGQGASGSGSSNKSADTKEHCCGVGGAQDAVCASAPNMIAALSPSAPISPSTPPSTQRTLTYATRPCSGAPGKRLALAQTLAHVLPSVNRYTLRELKIQNILQNPRLRHEVLFEPKLEFRPNTSGNMADAKHVATQQYWAAIEKGMSGWNPKALHTGDCRMSCGAADLSMVPVLLAEIREILAEMSEDAPNMAMARYAVELRERLDDERIRQQIDNNVFDPEPVVEYLAQVMRKLARPEHFASIDKLIEYARSGRFARALRMSFDVLEVLKIDIANRSIEMYREYMRSTAVAYERSHFGNMLRRNSVPIDETRAWWKKEYDAARGQFQSLDDIFSHVFRTLVLGGDRPVPKLMHMDEARINGIRREYERLEIVGYLFMGFTQFIQAVGRATASTGEPSDQQQQPEFRTENGRVDFERLGKECLKLVPECFVVNWSDSIGDSTAGEWRMPAGARGEVRASVLVTQLVSLAGRVLGRKIQPAEVTQLWRAVRSVVQSGSPVRGIVAGRIRSAVEMHLSSLEVNSTRFRGDAWEAMPEDAKLMLRRSMLGFLEPVLSSLAIKVHAIRAHHWLVYKSFYQALISSNSQLVQQTVTVAKAPSASSAAVAQSRAL